MYLLWDSIILQKLAWLSVLSYRIHGLKEIILCNFIRKKIYRFLSNSCTETKLTGSWITCFVPRCILIREAKHCASPLALWEAAFSDGGTWHPRADSPLPTLWGPFPNSGDISSGRGAQDWAPASPANWAESWQRERARHPSEGRQTGILIHPHNTSLNCLRHT